MRFSPLTLAGVLYTLLPLSFADVEFTTPNDKTSWGGGKSVTLQWKDSGEPPSLDDFLTFTVSLCSGSNAVPLCTAIGTPGSKFLPGATSTKVTVDPKAGASASNVYFIQIESIAKAGGFVRNYSPRFSLTGMTGTFTPDQIAQQKIGDTDPPSTENTVVKAPAAPAASKDLMDVPYAMQTGPTRYAPMQTQPGSRITATTAKRQYPTSDYTVFTTKGPKPDHATTVTAPWSYKVTSKVNTAAPAPHPDDMQRFLNRWKD